MVPAHPETVAMSRDFWARPDELIASSEIILGSTKAEIAIIEDFHNGYYMSAIIISRESD